MRCARHWSMMLSVMMLAQMFVTQIVGGITPDPVALLPFGPDQGDGNLLENGTIFLNDKVSPTFTPPYRFPACGSLQQNIYFTDNGLIFMYSGTKEKYAYPPPSQYVFSDGLPDDRVFIAPYFSDVDAGNFSTESNVYYQVYERTSNANTRTLTALNATTEIINEMQESNFSVEWMLLITWDKVQRTGNSNLSNTFQAIVATDGRRGYVVFNYQASSMLWDFHPTVLPSPWVVIGYHCQNESHCQNGSTYIQDPKHENYTDILMRPNEYVGNTKRQGLWVYRLDCNPDSYINPELECDRWDATQPHPSLWLTGDEADCPCSFSQATEDTRYEPLTYSLNTTDSNINETIIRHWASLEGCFYRTFKSSGSPGSLCCYKDNEHLRLFPDDVFYGTVIDQYSFNPHGISSDDDLTMQYMNWIRREMMPRYYCCIASTNPDFCTKYMNKRPNRTCSSYEPQNLAWFLGNGHFTTFDKAHYTFSGRGEYVILYDGTFQVFARTTYWTPTGPVTPATYFSSFLVRYGKPNTGESIEMRVDGNRAGFTYIHTPARYGTHYFITTEQIQQGFSFTSGVNCMVKLSDTSNRTIFSCPDGVSVSIGIKYGVADAIVYLPETYKFKKLMGLAGKWDDDEDNDISLGLDGTNQQPKSGENDTFLDSDYFAFGQTWQAPSAFGFYFSSGEYFGFFNQPVTSAPSTNNYAQAVVASADLSLRENCSYDSMCIYDSIVSGDEAFGLASVETHENNQNITGWLSSFKPNITSDISILKVFVNETLPIVMSAVDRNGDGVTFSVSINGVIHRANITNGDTFDLRLSTPDSVKLMVVATDGQLLSATTPVIILCTCTNETFCNYDSLLQDTNLFVEKFAIASCACPAGLTGSTCSDVNPFLLQPCCPGVDRPFSGDGFTCQGCPDDFYRNGRTCDILGVYPPLSYTCRCTTGYTGEHCAEEIISTTITSTVVTTPHVPAIPTQEDSTTITSTVATTPQVSAIPPHECVVYLCIALGCLLCVLCLMGILIWRLRCRHRKCRRCTMAFRVGYTNKESNNDQCKNDHDVPEDVADDGIVRNKVDQVERQPLPDQDSAF